MRSRILYVDDDEDMRDIVELALALDPDLSVETCASGEEALARLAQSTPDLVLLDAVMPGLDGPETLSRLRDIPGAGSVPVVFLSARAGEGDAAQFRSLGAAGVIAKPFDPARLAADVRAYLRR